MCVGVPMRGSPFQVSSSETNVGVHFGGGRSPAAPRGRRAGCLFRR